jgi:Mitochondrial domain of unknown function (DUF1713)
MNALRRGPISLLARRCLAPVPGCGVISSIRSYTIATQQPRIKSFLWWDCCHVLFTRQSSVSMPNWRCFYAMLSTPTAIPLCSLWKYPATVASELSRTVHSMVQDLMDWALWHMSSTLKKRRRKMSRHKWKKRRKLNRMKTKHKQK